METRSLALIALCVAACAEPLSEGDAAEPLQPLQRALQSRSDAFSSYANQFTQEYEPVAYAAVPLSGPVPVIAILSDNPLSPGKQFGTQSLASTLKQIYSKPEYQHHPKPDQYSKPEYHQYSKPESYQHFSKPDYQQNYVQTDYQYTKPVEEYQKPYADYPKYPKYAPTEYPKYPTVDYPKHYSSIEYGKPYSHVEYPKYPAVEYAASPAYAKPHPIEYAKPYAQEYDPYRSVEYTKPYQEEYVKPYAASVEAPTILYARPTANGGYTYSRRPLKKRNVKRPRKAVHKPVIIRVHKYRVLDRRSGY